ncbi:Variant-specific surface protein, partial [Giardia duodenalis]
SCKDIGMIYLKKDSPTGQTGTCVDANGCTGTNYIDEAAKTCSACASAGTTGCTTCERGADGAVVCKTCTTDGKTVFGLNKKSCVAKCPDNASEKSGVCTCNDGFTPNAGSSACTQCHSSCLTCSATDENSCTACTEGTHFLGAASGKGKCVSCGDAATGSNGFKGVTGCAKCTKPASAGAATCTECGTDLYLKTETGGATSCVASDKCTGGFFPMTDTADSNKKKCLVCSDGTNGIANCAECTAPSEPTNKSACAKCASGFLHTPEGGETSCPNSCPDGYFRHTSAESGSLKTCQSCSAPKEGLNPAVTGIPGCTQCTYAAARASTLKCTTCGSGFSKGMLSSCVWLLHSSWCHEDGPVHYGV